VRLMIPADRPFRTGMARIGQFNATPPEPERAGVLLAILHGARDVQRALSKRWP